MVFSEQISLSPRGRGSPLGQKQWLWSTLSPVANKHQPDKERLLYMADGKQDVAEERRGAHLQHVTAVRDMFQRYVKMTVMKEIGGERKKKKKKVFWPMSRGKGSFLSSDLMVQPREKCKLHQVLPSQREREREQGERQRRLSSPHACHLPQPDPRREAVLSCHCSRV